MKTTIEHSVDLKVPVRTAYAQWTQFEAFPQFMSRVADVRQIDERRVQATTDVNGDRRTWELEICEQIPDKRIAWKSVEGPRNAGVVTFHRIAPDRSRLMLQMEYEPDGLVQAAGDLVGLAKSRVATELVAFRDFIEQRGEPTGEWRGSIENPDERVAARG